jgi:hypothetical protein
MSEVLQATDAPVAPVAPKHTRTVDKRRAACMSAVRPADFARAYGMSGKTLRGTLRNKLGIYVSHGDAFDAKVKARLYDVLSKPAASKHVK